MKEILRRFVRNKESGVRQVYVVTSVRKGIGGSAASPLAGLKDIFVPQDVKSVTSSLNKPTSLSLLLSLSTYLEQHLSTFSSIKFYWVTKATLASVQLFS